MGEKQIRKRNKLIGFIIYYMGIVRKIKTDRKKESQLI